MRAIVLLALCLLPGLLSADRVFTADDKTFDGIVTTFDKERRLTLATGYGNLTFNVPTEVKSGLVSDYEWPKTSSLKKPARDARFETWAKELAARAAAADKAKGLPANWTTIPDTKEENEIDLAKLTDPISKMKNAEDGETETQRKERRARVVREMTGKWSYGAFRIESVKKEGDGVIRMEVSGQMFDPRTGREMYLGWKKSFAIIARKEWDAAAVDKENDKRMKPEPDVTLWAEEYAMDFERASTLKAGDGVVFKLVPYFDETGEDWDRVPMRYAPKARPIPRRD